MLTSACVRSSTNIRRSAFERLAAFNALRPGLSDSDQDSGPPSDSRRNGLRPKGLLDAVLKGHPPVSRVPMTIRELEILLALSKSSSNVSQQDHALRLASQLSEYLPESHSQLFQPSPFLLDIEPSPWEELTRSLTEALLSLSANHAPVFESAKTAVKEYLNSYLQAADASVSGPDRSAQFETRHDSAEIIVLTVSLVGFMEGASRFTHLWTTVEKLDIIQQLQEVLSENFLVAVETASSKLRTLSTADSSLREWRRYSRKYAAQRRPLGAMLLQKGLINLIKSFTTTAVLGSSVMDDDAFLTKYTTEFKRTINHSGDNEVSFVKHLTSIIGDEIQLLQDGADYLQIGSPWQQDLAFSVKASALIAFLNCTILDEEVADIDLLLSWLDDTITDPIQMARFDLATATLKIAASIANLFRANASNLSQSLLRFIVQGSPNASIASVAANCLAKILNILSQDSEDTVITTLYSLGNVLSPAAVSAERQAQPSIETVENSGNMDTYYSNTESVISLPGNSEEEIVVTHRNVIHAIVTLAVGRMNEKITALSQSMLLQKIGKINIVVDAYIIQETAKLALASRQSEFQLLLKFYARLHREGMLRGHSIIIDAVHNARIYLSYCLRHSPSHYRVYLVHLLERIISRGDATDYEHSRQKDVALSPGDITPFLKPLGILLSWQNEAAGQSAEASNYDEDTAALFRDAWFNIAVHGITLKSEMGRLYRDELRAIAVNSPTLVPENRTEILESDVELNVILRRGMTPQRVAEQKKLLVKELPDRESDIKRLTYQKAIFLNASLLVECLRASSGHCNKIFLYFLDPSLKSSEMGTCMDAVADKVISTYLSITLAGKDQDFSAPCLSNQLSGIFLYCCHRISRVQDVALSCAGKIITASPSSLCDRNSLFVLLDLLTIMWSSCLENELDEYGWKSTFSKGKVQIALSDNYDSRKRTLAAFHVQAKTWVTIAINISPLDVKGLLQTYLSEYVDDDTYGDISLGRSFALDMAAQIPQGDQRLGSIDKYGIQNINFASDFIAQYTARQEYRFSEVSLTNGQRIKAQTFVTNGAIDSNIHQPVRIVADDLERLSRRISTGDEVFGDETRQSLRNAAAVISRGMEIQPTIIHYLVGIPFQIFTKESIKFGISIWLGVIHENPEAESRVLTEMVEAWERTVRRRKGLFDPYFEHPDPFFTNIELLPSDKTALLRQQHKAQDLLSPHFRILQFFDSHFNAIRLGNPHSQRILTRMISSALLGLKHTGGHPLAREVHFYIILLALKIIRFSTAQSDTSRWKLKDLALSAALSWFRHPARWSLGGNRLQMKAEDRVLGDLELALKSLANLGSVNTGPRKSLRSKQELLQILIENERMRLKVWLFPLEQERKNHITGFGGKSQPEVVGSLLQIAWNENPSLAIQIATRFPSQKVQHEVRWLLLNFPEKALDAPESLEIMLGTALPSDISFQLKYLLYWAPVAPIEALTFFLPAYGNHPFILQYAMRALESHSIDVRFYLVPQLVQALRYDALGYVERYIYETAKLSQLFAHQVIWNMKANAYKDEDSQIPDSVKPTLDSFMERLISSFSTDERDFYEREFSFFNEVTGVSGKLRPFIKKSKPEKKQKIEEELRKIKVEVGVYLPSNPDGVVVGIDRKSGKPLQSHAKAPYMATFRIQKTRPVERAVDKGAREKQLLQNGSKSTSAEHSSETYEVWQSAIFKVGDDCRQDVLALQLIAAFRSVFNSVGLDVWVFPYRVTATAPGCGVIDVLPNSISRDMLGREAVNGLYDYFVSKYGGEESTRFQEARTNFVKSMASYSVISYLLQFKDRHNGNIMIDDAGHIIHIDFGFCFDIAPGGVRFERAPFKLTSEMVAVMGGVQHVAGGNSSGTLHIPGTHGHDPTGTQSYKWFESLCVKAFLASRPHANKFIQIVTMMLDSGLPCFKPETIKNFRDRFVLDKSEREAADYMRDLIDKSYLSLSTKGYDQFQLMTNGIPY
ncbi:putative phosphatidylinositol 4-kinase [Talaromyces proteolyticus]|uniref:1-phosphatidylinositol 4-kinase n=1 Tax=Talaromyces proteolyticus TaxID=1131652 RepID=A0AAD4PYS3_9EURO|nr:putative phosphatidylinositol 4-kinase [Talaromyces proteolyticus]KAH8698261.1 putative phosphatidylinositol 4-kinase [Talaromyces proteolyticus]